MKLSEAIRLGAMVRPQAFNCHTEDTTCALQAACDAIGWSVSDWSHLHKAYPFLRHPAKCPVENAPPDMWCDCADNIKAAIWHLNDQHRWTREAIADWVATIENAVETPKEAEEVSQ